MLTLYEYLQQTYPVRPAGTIKGVLEDRQKEIAKQFETHSISQVAVKFNIEYETARRIFHKWRKK